MGYYPVFLDLDNARCLVVGGGAIAERKVDALLASDGVVTVVSPVLTRGLQELAAAQRISVVRRPYKKEDLVGVSLVIAATDDPALQQQIAADTKRAHIFCNVVDQPDLCSFVVPGVVKQGDLTLAISTNGTSPAMAKKIRQDLTEQFGPEYAQALRLLGRIRERVAEENRSVEDRRRVFTSLAKSPLLDYLREGQADKLNALLQQALGEGYTVEGLAFSL